ncbi:MAG: multiheme c-type cytochrome [Limisphaerales bacterium]
MQTSSLQPIRRRARSLGFLAVLLAGLATASAAEYVGSATCAACHKKQGDLLKQSIHSKMIRPANGAELVQVHGNLAAPKAPKPGDFTHVMGGWYKEESYIKAVTNVDNTVSYTVLNYQWDPIKGTYVDNQALRDWLVKCAGCHTTGYQPGTRTFTEFNIGCEGCHGAGSEHVDGFGDKSKIVIDRSSEGCGYCHIRAENAATAEFAAKTFNFPIGYQLGKPETLAFIPDALTNASSFFPDGTSKRHRQQYLDTHYPGVRVTKHFEKGVSCTQCHDPHTSGVVTTHDTALPAGVYGIKIYDNVANTTKYVAWDGEGLSRPRDQLCTTCHASVAADHVHQFTPAASLAAQAGAPSCVDCHMLDVINVDPVTLRGALHTHTYHTLRPETSLKLGPGAQPSSCTYRCHQDKGADVTARVQWAAQYTEIRLTPVAGAAFKLVGKGLKDFDYLIQGSMDFQAWTDLGTQKAVNGTFELQDATALEHRFYRAIEQ